MRLNLVKPPIPKLAIPPTTSEIIADLTNMPLADLVELGIAWRVEADKRLDEMAAEKARSCPGVPANTIRHCMTRGAHPLDALLRLIEQKEPRE